ncbi:MULTISPECIES: hypothetical protein [Amycolatopsis]|uniref:hypothetical protein n=1 Tax=Amycolatopsis TaxID=1813 RepID=UPI00106F9958|nr:MULTISPECIES: hypothetical protein [Amycolatopsis]
MPDYRCTGGHPGQVVAAVRVERSVQAADLSEDQAVCGGATGVRGRHLKRNRSASSRARVCSSAPIRSSTALRVSAFPRQSTGIIRLQTGDRVLADERAGRERFSITGAARQTRQYDRVPRQNPARHLS